MFSVPFTKSRKRQFPALIIQQVQFKKTHHFDAGF